jgi:hypothetical protein
MRNATRTCLALALLLGALAALPSSVSAESRHIDQTQCFSFPQVFPDGSVYIFTICQRVEGVVQDTATSSGNTTHVLNDGTVTQTLAINDVPQPGVYAYVRVALRHRYGGWHPAGGESAIHGDVHHRRAAGVWTGHLQFSNGELRFTRPTFRLQLAVTKLNTCRRA